MVDLDKEQDSDVWLYCANCLSPKIKYEEKVNSDCCCDCGSTSICESTFDIWENKYNKRYKHKYVEVHKDIRKSPIYQMSFVELMKKVSDYCRWEDIIISIYGVLPKGVSKADSIVMFFDKLIRDNKLDTLREVLYKLKV